MELNLEKLIENALSSLNGIAAVANSSDYFEGVRDVLSALNFSPEEMRNVIRKIREAEFKAFVR